MIRCILLSRMSIYRGHRANVLIVNVPTFITAEVLGILIAAYHSFPSGLILTLLLPDN